MTSTIKVDTISENTSANGVTIDGLTIKDGNIIGDVALAGTTPTFTIGDAGAEDASLIFDGNAVDYYIGLDDSADNLIIGSGSTVGSNSLITIDSDGDFTFDSAADIILDAGGSDISLKGAGAEYGKFNLSGNNLNIHSSISNGDIVFKGNDGGSAITALTLDMSDAGTAKFNHNIKLNTDDGFLSSGASDDFLFVHDGTDSKVFNSTGDLIIDNTASDKDIILKGSDGGSAITALTLDMSAAGLAKFNAGLAIGGTGAANTLDDYEEGTWDPAATFNDDGATGHGGKYTKIGNVVIVTFSITFGSTSFGAVISVSGLPFAATSTPSGIGIGGAMIKGYYDGSSTNLSGYIGDSSSQIDLRENEVHLTHNSDKILGKNLRATAVYHVN